MAAVDLVIRNGKIVDGTGDPPYKGDIAIKDGIITEISNGEKLDVLGLKEIDATDRIVSPGWVDVHTHLDGQLTWDRLIAPFTANGVTTAIIGNCGVGFAPCKKEDRKFLMELMEGVEDIPFGCMEMSISWNWESFPEFLDYLESLKFGCDIAAMVGHGAVRAYCLGKKANITDRPGAFKDPRLQITPEEIQKMADIVREAISAGAIGFSTSRTLLHRDKTGTLVPGTLAAEEELLAIGNAIAEGGGGVFELASDFMSYDDAPHTDEDHVIRLEHFDREWIWIEQISKGFGIPVSICLGIPSVLTPGIDCNGYRMFFSQAANANASGSNIKLQVFTRPQGIQMCWDSRSHPFVEAPTYVKLLREAIREHREIDKKALTDPSVKARILEETNNDISIAADDVGTFGVVLPTSTDDEEDIFLGNLNGSVSGRGALAKFFRSGVGYIYKWREDYEPKAEDSVEAVAANLDREPFEVLYDWLCEDGGKRVVSFLFMNYHKKTLDDVCEMLFNEESIPGLGDAGAHAGFIVDSTSHTYLLTHHVRDRILGPRIPIEYAIKRHTSDTAHYFGLMDRGVLQVGKKADINIINLETLRCLCPEFVHDLPKNGSRWIQRSEGYDFTILSGEIVYQNGVHTGKLPGRLVRNPSAGKGLPKSYKYGNLTGNMIMWLTKAKQETRHMAFRALLRVLGPKNLESIGEFLSSYPLKMDSRARL